MALRVLLIEDDRRTADYVAQGLVEAGHACDAFGDGAHALVQATHERYDVMIVDRMVPGLDGLNVVRTLRSIGNLTPVLFLTALDDVDDRVAGFEAGGDDYLVKPFAFSELLARVQALGRRPPIAEPVPVLRVHDLELDTESHRVTRAGRTLELNAKEFRLLEVLMRNTGRVVTRTMLLERVWNVHFEPQTSVVETHVSRLRAKLDKPFDRALLHTVRGIGYSLHAD